MDATWFAVELDDHELADVVKERGHRELVTLRKPRQLADALGADADGDTVAAEALPAVCGDARCLEDVVGLEIGCKLLDALDAQRLDRLADPTRASRRAVAVVGRAHDRDRQRGIGLDRLGKLVRGARRLVAEAEQAAARLREGRQRRYRFKRVGKATSADAPAGVRRALFRGLFLV